MNQRPKRGRPKVFIEKRVNRKIYFQRDDYKIIKQGAKLAGVSITQFVNDSSKKEAERLIKREPTEAPKEE